MTGLDHGIRSGNNGNKAPILNRKNWVVQTHWSELYFKSFTALKFQPLNALELLKLKNKFNQNLWLYEVVSLLFQLSFSFLSVTICAFMGLLCGGSTWECPWETPLLRLLQRCCPQWRSGHACSPALESQLYSTDLQKRDPFTHSACKQRGTWWALLVISAWRVLTLAAVALCALFGSAAPLRATAAGAAWTGLAWWWHLWPWRCTSRRCCHSLCHDAAHPAPQRNTAHTNTTHTVLHYHQWNLNGISFWMQAINTIKQKRKDSWI